MHADNHLRCPITLEVMRDPVIDNEGNTYEREAILKWIHRKHTSPITRAPLHESDLTVNRAIYNLIHSAESIASCAISDEKDDSPTATSLPAPAIAAIKREAVTLPTPSSEQQAIIDAAQEGYNVVVDSVPGSGKTTTILSVCRALVGVHVLVLTYNSRLKLETRDKCEQIGLRHRVEIHSYHALAVKYYDNDAHTDEGINRILENDTRPRINNRDIQMLVLDEQQDMTLTYYRLVCKWIRDMGISADRLQILTLGDVKQSIYQFKQADARFLSLSHSVFSAFSSKPWKRLNIHTSFRMTHSMCAFLNVLDGRDGQPNAIRAVKDGPPVNYVVCDTFNSTIPYQTVLKYLEKGYKPEDIFVLAPSMRCVDNCPIHTLENWLVTIDKIPCFISISDDMRLDKDVVRGKITFCTYHQAKGLERAIVLVFGMDANYLKYYCKSPFERMRALSECPNPVYVAVSRAKDELCIFHNVYRNQPAQCLPRLHHQRLQELVDAGVVKLEICRQRQKTLLEEYEPIASEEDDIHKSVTDILRFMDEDVIDVIFRTNHIQICQLHPKDHDLKLSAKVASYKPEMCEFVADITGTALPAYYEFINTGDCAVYKKTLAASSYSSPSALESPEVLLKETTKYDSITSGYLSRRYQILDYTWLKQKQLVHSCKRFDSLFAKTTNVPVRNLLFEEEYNITTKDLLPKTSVSINGRVDVQTQDYSTLYEIKCVSTLTRTHIMQLILYAWLIKEHRLQEAKKDKKVDACLPAESYMPRNLYLYNVNTDELQQVVINTATELDCIVKDIVSEYLRQPPQVSNAEFLAQCERV